VEITIGPDHRVKDSTYYGLDNKPVRTRVIVRDMPKIFWSGVKDLFDLRPGDVLLSYNGKKIRCARKFQDLRRYETGGRWPRILRVLRAGKVVRVRVQPGLPDSAWILETRAVPPKKDKP
jgi:hypothetical protein